jgi:translation initiation factor 1 (eIF-1/SUI1)
VDAKNVWVKAGRVEVKGRHKREIAQWLESKGF